MRFTKKPYDFEESFLRVKNGLHHLYPSLSCFYWLSTFNLFKNPSSVHSLYPKPSPEGVDVDKAMRYLFIPALNDTHKHLLFWENLEPPNEDGFFIKKAWYQRGYTRGFILRAPSKQRNYVGGLIMRGWDSSSFDLFSKISFPFLEFFDIGIRQLQSRLCPKPF